MPDLDPAHERLAANLRDAFAVAPDEGARARTRAVILDAPASARKIPRVRRRLVVPIAATFLALSATGAAAVPLSATALPGDALHGVRMASERIRILLASNPGDEAQVHLAIARARTADIERALARGRDDALAELGRRFFEQLGAADELRGNTAQDRADRISAVIAAQRARLDAITARVETAGPTKHRKHPEEVVRRIREHENDPRPDHPRGRRDDRDDRDRRDDRPDQGRSRGPTTRRPGPDGND